MRTRALRVAVALCLPALAWAGASCGGGGGTAAPGDGVGGAGGMGGSAGATTGGGAGAGGRAGAAGSQGAAGSAGATSAAGSSGSSGAAGSGGSSGSAAGAAGASGPDAAVSSGNDAGPAVVDGVPQACRALVEGAKAMLTAVEGEPAKRTLLARAYDQRKRFKFTPGARPGLPLAGMSAAQQTKALDFVRTGLSQAGFAKAETIRSLELWLRAEENSQSRDPLGYYLSIYGTPSTDGDWAWSWEGHHLSLHFAFSKCTRVASTPAFMGTNPAEVRKAHPGAPAVGTRVLAKEEDLARELATMVAADAAKRALAIHPNVSRDTPETVSVTAPSPKGLDAAMMSPAERAKLLDLVTEYASTVAPALAAERLQRVRDAGGIEKVSFLWGGSLTKGQAHYYRITGPTFLIEYQNAQNAANHVHSAWRDFDGDYGEDLIKMHMLQVPHGHKH